jgi:hypothetical protein
MSFRALEICKSPINLHWGVALKVQSAPRSGLISTVLGTCGPGVVGQ